MRVGESQPPGSGAWVVIFALILMGILLVLCQPANSAPLQKRSEQTTTLMRIYKPDGDWCARCKVVEDALVSYGVKVVRVCEIRKPPPYYPQCVYGDKTQDSGDRILRGQCKFASKVYVITVMEAKK